MVTSHDTCNRVHLDSATTRCCRSSSSTECTSTLHQSHLLVPNFRKGFIFELLQHQSHRMLGPLRNVYPRKMRELAIPGSGGENCPASTVLGWRAICHSSGPLHAQHEPLVLSGTDRNSENEPLMDDLRRSALTPTGCTLLSCNSSVL